MSWHVQCCAALVNLARLALTVALHAGALLCAKSVHADALRRIEQVSYEEREEPAAHASEAHEANEADYVSSDSDSEDGFGSAIGRAGLYVLLSPWLVPHALLDDACFDGYTRYPYEDGRGYLGTRACAPDGTSEARKLAFDASLESGYMFERVLSTSANMRLHLPARMELDTRVSLLRDLAEQPSEHALNMTSHLAFRFARSSHLDFRSGVGLRLYHFNVTQLGVDLLYAVDAYLGRGVIARVELHGGSLAHALAAQARATIGVMVSSFEMYAGYDHTAYFADAGDARLGGPIAGIRGFF